MNRELLLIRLIEDTGMNQKAFAEKIGIPYSTLRSMLKNGIGGTGMDVMLKICEQLGIKVEDLKPDQEAASKIEKTSIIQKMKFARIKSGFTQEEICEKLGISEEIFKSWELGELMPDVECFLKMCKLYNINYISDMLDNYTDEDKINNLSKSEEELIKKYRAIDMRGKKMVCSLLDVEYKRHEDIESIDKVNC